MGCAIRNGLLCFTVKVEEGGALNEGFSDQIQGPGQICIPLGRRPIGHLALISPLPFRRAGSAARMCSIFTSTKLIKFPLHVCPFLASFSLDQQMAANIDQTWALIYTYRLLFYAFPWIYLNKNNESNLHLSHPLLLTLKGYSIVELVYPFEIVAIKF